MLLYNYNNYVSDSVLLTLLIFMLMTKTFESAYINIIIMSLTQYSMQPLGQSV